MKQTLLLLLSICTLQSFAQKNINGEMTINGAKRIYIVHLPENYSQSVNYPLVLIFHGGGGNAAQMQNFMKMDPIADREGFITVYPQGLNKHWNDGRELDQKVSSNDDLQFVEQLLDTVSSHYSIDKKRIFSTGISNGGFMSIFLSYKLSDKLLAVAPVCASIPEKIYGEFYPKQPISVLIINGTKDPLVPFEGGIVGNSLTGGRGNCTSTDNTIKRYIGVDGTATNPKSVSYPDNAPFDGCTATRYEYNNGKNNTRVVLIKITNGGHTLPGGSQYLPKFLVGKVCNDFKGNEEIWKFFKESNAK
ncbi:MAG: hypothetical protein C5B52_04085 [Bacteroidetes bacterium]|nr:MAG: hypothetical protein C5B52_04085 [Bacteroidota bacterium]